MKDTIKKVLNIYVVSGLIAFFVILYLVSFFMVTSKISSGSSLQMQKERMQQPKK
jgi:hypothetical protein